VLADAPGDDDGDVIDGVGDRQQCSGVVAIPSRQLKASILLAELSE
jgi:hypothetical protein